MLVQWLHVSWGYSRFTARFSLLMIVYCTACCSRLGPMLHVRVPWRWRDWRVRGGAGVARVILRCGGRDGLSCTMRAVIHARHLAMRAVRAVGAMTALRGLGHRAVGGAPVGLGRRHAWRARHRRVLQWHGGSLRVAGVLRDCCAGDQPSGQAQRQAGQRACAHPAAGRRRKSAHEHLQERSGERCAATSGGRVNGS